MTAGVNSRVRGGEGRARKASLSAPVAHPCHPTKKEKGDQSRVGRKKQEGERGATGGPQGGLAGSMQGKSRAIRQASPNTESAPWGRNQGKSRGTGARGDERQLKTQSISAGEKLWKCQGQKEVQAGGGLVSRLSNLGAGACLSSPRKALLSLPSH